MEPSEATAVSTAPSPAPGEGTTVGLVFAADFAGAFFRAGFAAGSAVAVTDFAVLAAAALVRGARVPVATVVEPVGVLAAAASGAG